MPESPSNQKCRTRALAGSLALALFGGLAGCKGGAPAVSGNVNLPPGTALIQGNVTGPQGLVSNNSSKIVSNNAGNIVANNAAGVIANNAAGYRVADLQVDPVSDALVYLTDPSEHFYADQSGRILSTTTDSSGNYTFPVKIPPFLNTIVDVVLSGNRREVGYSIPAAGSNVVNVSVASTFVTEFLRLHANQDGRSMGGYPAGLTPLPNLTALTQQALNDGSLPFDPTPTGSLNIGNIPTLLDMSYALAVGENADGLGDAWANLLGYRINALATVIGDGTGNVGGSGSVPNVEVMTPKGMARDAAGDLFIAEERNNFIREIFTDGTTKAIAGQSWGASGYSGDGGKATHAYLFWPRTVAIGPDGNLYVSDALNYHIRVVALTSTPSPWVSGSWTVGDIYDVAGSTTTDGSVDGPATASVGAAQIDAPQGMVFDSKGNLYFTEGFSDSSSQNWNHVRVLTPPNAGTQTLFGVSCGPGAVTTLAGPANQAGYNGDGIPATSAQLDYPEQITVDPEGNLVFADSRNGRIRCIAAQTGTYYGQAMTAGDIYTLAGNGVLATAGDGGAPTLAAINRPFGVAVDNQFRLYISSHNDGIIRVVSNGTIKSVAGGGIYTIDGDAHQVSMAEPHDVLLEPDGNLLIAESRGARVRRLYLQWGF